MPSGSHFILFPCAHIEETLDDETPLFQFIRYSGTSRSEVSWGEMQLFTEGPTDPGGNGLSLGGEVEVIFYSIRSDGVN